MDQNPDNVFRTWDDTVAVAFDNEGLGISRFGFCALFPGLYMAHLHFCCCAVFAKASQPCHSGEL